MHLDIEKLAEECDIDPNDMCEDPRIGLHRLQRFATLLLEKAAMVCDADAEDTKRPALRLRPDFRDGMVCGAENCADAIRTLSRQITEGK